MDVPWDFVVVDSVPNVCLHWQIRSECDDWCSVGIERTTRPIKNVYRSNSSFSWILLSTQCRSKEEVNRHRILKWSVFEQREVWFFYWMNGKSKAYINDTCKRIANFLESELNYANQQQSRIESLLLTKVHFIELFACLEWNQTDRPQK